MTCNFKLSDIIWILEFVNLLTTKKCKKKVIFSPPLDTIRKCDIWRLVIIATTKCGHHKMFYKSICFFQNFGFCLKFRLLDKILIFNRYFNFWPPYVFWPNFHFLEQEVFSQIFNFWNITFFGQIFNFLNRKFFCPNFQFLEHQVFGPTFWERATK